MDPTPALRQSLHSQVNTFLTRIEGIYKENGIETTFLRSNIMENIMPGLLPQQHSRYETHSNPLADFLKSTINKSCINKKNDGIGIKDFSSISNSKDQLFNSFSRPFNSSLHSSFQSLFKNQGQIKIQEKNGSISRQQDSLLMGMNSIHSKNCLIGNINSSSSDLEHLRMKYLKSPNFGMMSMENSGIKKMYKTLTFEEKQQIVNHSLQFGLKDTSSVYGIAPYKIKQWSRSIKAEKKTRGRKPTDPSMEKQICQWLEVQLKKGTQLTQKAIRDHAKNISKCQVFKASKGWLQKFFKRRPQLFEAYTINRRRYLNNTGQSKESISKSEYEQCISNQIIIKKEEQPYEPES